MSKPEMIRLPFIETLTEQGYERYLPTAFDESLTYLEKINKIIHYMNEISVLTNEMIQKWNEVYEWVMGEGLALAVSVMLEKWKNDGTLADIINEEIFENLNQQIRTLIEDMSAIKKSYESLKTGLGDVKNITDRFTPVGEDSLELPGSHYIGNDSNLFGRLPDGKTYTNIGTVQQNGIVQYGDENARIMWFIADQYFSFRSKGNPTYQKLKDDFTSDGPGRTMLHQGNSSYHLIVYADGTQTLIEDFENYLDILTTINGVFPPDGYVNGKYTIPRAGMYLYQPILKLDTGTGQGYIRVGIEILRNGNMITSEMLDMYYNCELYNSPFVGDTFMYRHSAGDQVRLFYKPLNSAIVVENGTKLFIRQLGDVIQE